MHYSNHFFILLEEYRNLFSDFESEWDAIGELWKDPKYKEFEENEIDPMILLNNDLLLVFEDLCSCIKELEDKGFI